MTGADRIPDETKWRLAAGFSATIPALYDHAFQKTPGAKCDEIGQEVWMQAGLRIPEIARGLSLPLRTAQDLANALCTILNVLFGPEFKNEALEITPDGSVIVIRRCPLVAAGHAAGCDGELTFRKCMAFILTGVPALNRDFSARFVRTMCSGDRQCEIRITYGQHQDP